MTVRYDIFISHLFIFRLLLPIFASTNLTYTSYQYTFLFTNPWLCNTWFRNLDLDFKIDNGSYSLKNLIFYSLSMIHVLTKLVENVHGHIYNELKKINLTKKNMIITECRIIVTYVKSDWPSHFTVHIISLSIKRVLITWLGFL